MAQIVPIYWTLVCNRVIHDEERYSNQSKYRKRRRRNQAPKARLLHCASFVFVVVFHLEQVTFARFRNEHGYQIDMASIGRACWNFTFAEMARATGDSSLRRAIHAIHSLWVSDWDSPPRLPTIKSRHGRPLRTISRSHDRQVAAAKAVNNPQLFGQVAKRTCLAKPRNTEENGNHRS